MDRWRTSTNDPDKRAPLLEDEILQVLPKVLSPWVRPGSPMLAEEFDILKLRVPGLSPAALQPHEASALHRDPRTVAIPKPIVGSVEVSVLPEQPDSDDDGVGLCLQEGEENEEATTEEEHVFPPQCLPPER